MGIWDNVRNLQQQQLGMMNSMSQTPESVKTGQQAANTNLYDPATMASLKEIFGPYFASQFGLLNRAQGGAMGQAGRTAGAQAGSMNLANPGAYTLSAQQRVAGQYAPQFEALASGQMGNLLNATAQSNQFRSGNLFNLAQLQQAPEQRQFQYGMSNLEYQRQLANQPQWWQYLLGGGMGALGSIGSALIGMPSSPAGGGGGTGKFG